MENDWQNEKYLEERRFKLSRVFPFWKRERRDWGSQKEHD